jgi:hypothetical protein
MAPGEYFMVCRKLFSDLSSPGYEEIWGNNTGIWGDTATESSLSILFDPVTFSLTNTSGNIRLYNAFNILVSDFQWTSSGSDGISWERVFVDSAQILQCIRIEGSTPGFVNSVSPVAFDLSLEQIDITPFGGSTIVFFNIVNRSYNIIAGAKLYFFQYPGDSLATPTDTIQVFDLPDALPGFTTLIGGNYSFDGVYDTLLAKLSDDDRPQNNRQTFAVTGRDFPALFINEFLANPTPQVGSEWVEVKNNSNSAIDLRDWQIGDSLSLKTVVDSSSLLYPGEYLVLAQDTVSFLNYYNSFMGLLLEPLGWSALNNTFDKIRLIDNYGFGSDSLSYADLYSENFTWAMAEAGVNSGTWGRSQDTGGTPGAMNRVVFTSLGDDVTLSIAPEHISPDGDGIDDRATFTLEAPESDSYSLRIFDRHGREVRTIIRNENYLAPSYEWDGLDDSGKRLPIGIYIVIFEVSGIKDVKKTIVIAR